MIVSGIGEGPLDEGEEASRDVEYRAAAVTILDAGGMRLDDQAAAVGVDKAWRLRPLIFLPAS